MGGCLFVCLLVHQQQHPSLQATAAHPQPPQPTAADAAAPSHTCWYTGSSAFSRALMAASPRVACMAEVAVGATGGSWCRLSLAALMTGSILRVRVRRRVCVCVCLVCVCACAHAYTSARPPSYMQQFSAPPPVHEAQEVGRAELDLHHALWLQHSSPAVQNTWG